MSGERSELKTILVLDDDPQFHKLIVPVLTSRGHRVLSAQSGKEAEDLVAAGSPDLIIVDGQLPDVTGIEWIADLRASGNAAIVMFVSAYWRDAQSYHKLTKELGVALVLHKPVLASVFAAEVDILLGKGPGTTGTQAAIDDFEDTLLALRSEYAKELPARLAELTEHLEQTRSQPDNLFLNGQARTSAHKLRGTAASYGFPEIGEVAGQLEELIIALPNSKEREKVEKQLLASVAKANSLASAAASDHAHQKPANGLSTTSEQSEYTAIARILVVDDDAAFLDLIDEFARMHELEIVRASNRSEALDMACMAQIDAALIDVDLGSRDTAFKLAGELRALPGYSDLPLAFVHGAGHIEKSVEIEDVGACVYIDKPLRADALNAAVRQLVAIRQATRPKVLLIDDDSDFSKRTAFVLMHEGMQVKTLDTTVNIMEEMQQYGPDLLLLDVMMPGVSGFDICRMLRTVPRWRDLPIMFLTAYTDVDTRVACLKCGGDDYLCKPVVNEELFVRIKMRLERARLQKQRSDRDSVTGLLTRRSFMEQLSGAVSEAQRHDWNATVCMLQIDKWHSDPRNHLVADTVIQAASNLLQKRLRAEDLKGRWSDNKLILAFRNESEEVVQRLIKGVIEEFSTMVFAAPDGLELTPMLHQGIAHFPEDGTTIHELLEAADRRLHPQIRELHPGERPVAGR